MVLPIGILMIEHRTIEKMIGLMKKEIERIETEKEARPFFIDTAIDFIRNYADATHHGKEEDILFEQLKKKELEPEHQQIMDELIEEHNWARKTTGNLGKVKDVYQNGDETALDEIIDLMKELTEFYPQHIEKEDKEFFKPVMDYFTQEEIEDMLNRNYDFDRQILHDLYKQKVATAESRFFE